MKRKIIATICGVVIAVTGAISLEGCGCSDKNASENKQSVVSSSVTENPSQKIIGKWNSSENAVVQFEKDGTYDYNGIQGQYSIDEDNTLTITTNNNPSQSTVFEYYSGEISSALPSNQWGISGDTIYIGSYQYTKTENAENEEATSVSGKNQKTVQSEGETKEMTSSKEENHTENMSPTENGNINNPQIPTEELQSGEEEKVVTIYEEIDGDFDD